MFNKIKKSWIKFIFARKKIKELQKEIEFLQGLWLLAKSVSTKKYYGSSFKPSEILGAHEFYLKTNLNCRSTLKQQASNKR